MRSGLESVTVFLWLYPVLWSLGGGLSSFRVDRCSWTAASCQRPEKVFVAAFVSIKGHAGSVLILEGPRTCSSRSLVPKTIEGRVAVC